MNVTKGKIYFWDNSHFIEANKDSEDVLYYVRYIYYSKSSNRKYTTNSDTANVSLENTNTREATQQETDWFNYCFSAFKDYEIGISLSEFLHLKNTHEHYECY